MAMKRELIINEVAFVEDLLSSTTLKEADNARNEFKVPPYTAVGYFVRYYYGLGLGLKETTEKVLSKMNEFNIDVVSYEEYLGADCIKKYFKALAKGKIKLLRSVDTIPLYKSEYDKIMMCDTDKEKKVLFTIYILARYTNKYGWVYQSQNDISKLANVSTSVMTKENILHDLLTKHQIKITRKIDDTKIGVDLSDGVDDEVVLEIDKMEYLGNKFMAFLKPKYIVCTECGKLVKKKNKEGRPMKYCDKCANKIIKNNWKEASKRYRSAKTS